MPVPQLSSEFLDYLAHAPETPGDSEANGVNRLPSLAELSKQMGISVARLREQLEVAEALGLVEVRPRTGIRRLPYSFLPAVLQSLSYAVALDRRYFDLFAALRNQVEAAFWRVAVQQLTPADIETLQALTARAWAKLDGEPVQIPHTEHRQLHLTIFSRLDNPFVVGILEAYWEAYEAVGLNVYADYDYLCQVWAYHQAIVDALQQGDIEASYQAFVDHKDLLYLRSVANGFNRAEGRSAPNRRSQEVLDLRPNPEI